MTLGSAAAVIATIRDDAALEIDRIEREATDTIDALGRAGGPPPDPERQRQLDEVRRAASDAETQDSWEETAAALGDREVWIDGVIAAGEQTLARVADVAATRDWIARLVREALPHVPGDTCIIKAPPACATVLDEDWKKAIEAAAARHLVLRFEGPAAGCIVESADGAVTFDNSVGARSRRLAPIWRPALARIYEAAVQPRTRSGRAAVAGAA